MTEPYIDQAINDDARTLTECPAARNPKKNAAMPSYAPPTLWPRANGSVEVNEGPLTFNGGPYNMSQTVKRTNMFADASLNFPFLDRTLLNWREGCPQLFLNIFPPCRCRMTRL